MSEPLDLSSLGPLAQEAFKRLDARLTETNKVAMQVMRRQVASESDALSRTVRSAADRWFKIHRPCDSSANELANEIWCALTDAEERIAGKE